MKQLVFVFIGGGFGSIARYVLSKYFNSESSGIPFGTFFANVLVRANWHKWSSTQVG